MVYTETLSPDTRWSRSVEAIHAHLNRFSAPTEESTKTPTNSKESNTPLSICPEAHNWSDEELAYYRQTGMIPNPTHEQSALGYGPVSIETFVTHEEYLNMPFFWPKPLEDLRRLKAPGILGGVIVEGIGGGKTYKISTIPLYDIYRLEYMRRYRGEDLQTKYRLDPRNTTIYACILTVTQELARELFSYMKGFAEGCAWFARHLPLDPNIKSRLRFLDPDTGSCRYVAYPGHSKFSSIIGKNVFSCVIDEINFFEAPTSYGSSQKDYAEELHDTAERRIRSRFSLDGSLILISSRNTVNDYTERRRRELQSDPEIAKQYYLPPPKKTWDNWPEANCTEHPWKEFDPDTYVWASPQTADYDTIKETHALWVPKRFWEAFQNDPENALKDYASVPLEAKQPFFRRVQAIIPDYGDKLAGIEPLINPILPGVQAYDWMADLQGHALYDHFDSLVAEWFVGEEGEYYHIHGDMSLGVRDAAGLAVARNTGSVAIAYQDKDRGERAAVVDIELVLQMRARPGNEIRLSRFRDIVFWLAEARRFKLSYSSFDGWQSIDAIQILEDAGYQFEVLSVDRTVEPYNSLKQGLYDGRCNLPCAHGQTVDTTYDEVKYLADQGDPCAILQVELRQLEFLDGKKVDHPTHGSKDLADAVCGANYHAVSWIRPNAEW